MPGFQRYTAFVKAHREANPEITNKEIQTRAAQALWKDVKNDPEKQQQMIFEFRTKTANRERKLMGFWNKALRTVPAKTGITAPNSNSAQPTASTSALTENSAQPTASTSALSENSTIENPSDHEKKNPDELESSSKGKPLHIVLCPVF